MSSIQTLPVGEANPGTVSIMVISDIKLCPKCGDEMSTDYISNQVECFNCGHVVDRSIRHRDHEQPGKYDEKWLTFPDRYRAVIYRVMPLWMAKVQPDVVEFEFAADVPDLRAKDNGFKYRLISIFAAKGFPWPTDLAQESRKDSRATNTPTHITQLRRAIAGAVAQALGVNECEVKDLDIVIKTATIPERIKKRRMRVKTS